jgi:hypothetical protein
MYLPKPVLWNDTIMSLVSKIRRWFVYTNDYFVLHIHVFIFLLTPGLQISVDCLRGCHRMVVV